MDSTLYKGGLSSSASHSFDFTCAPDKTIWNFNTDPCVEDENGYFTEYPIAAKRVMPLFFWKFVLIKLFGNKKLHTSFGDGEAIKNSRKDLLRMLTRPTDSVVSVDGYKASYLLEAFKHAKKRGDDSFVVIGHPKALTEYSLKKVDDWLAYMKFSDMSLSTY
jgi:hypothetical protein